MKKRGRVARVTDPDSIYQGVLVQLFDMALEGGFNVVVVGSREWKGSRCV